MVRGFIRNPEQIGGDSSTPIEDERDDVHFAWLERDGEKQDYISVVFEGDVYELHKSEGGDRGWETIDTFRTKEKARKGAVDYLRNEYDK